VILLATIAMMAAASEPGTLRLPPAVARAFPGLNEAGTGTLRWFGLRVYDARLWVSSDRPSPDRPFVLALRYARDFEAGSIARASIEEIERLAFGTAQDRSRWLAAMQGVFPDVKEGHELAGLNLPGQGVRFFLDGRAIGEIADAEFARAFFAIWLDPRTKAPTLRVTLLGEDASRR